MPASLMPFVVSSDAANTGLLRTLSLQKPGNTPETSKVFAAACGA